MSYEPGQSGWVRYNVSMSLTSTSSDWYLRGNFYSLYIDKFAGDIPGLTARLDYFTALGIDCLHLLPHYPSPMQDDGFDITDHTGVRPELQATTET